MSEGFTTNLGYLNKIHSEKLPLVVQNQQDTLTGIERALDETERAFHGPSDICLEAQSAWEAAGTFLARIVQRNHDTLELTRDAVAEIAQRYQELEGLK